MDVRAFDFDLPAELIAQTPAPDRSAARLLELSRATGAITHGSIARLPEHLRAGDVIVVNNTRVFPARLLGRRVPTGGAVECLLIRRVSDASASESAEVWEALMHPGQKLKPGAEVVFDGVTPIRGHVIDWHYFGRRAIELRTEDGTPIDAAIDRIGHVPLPPYIRREDRIEDRDQYQTVFARARGSVAAPTAGLHFTRSLVDDLERRGVRIVEITLHVGYGTFQPVRVERVEDHRLEPERFAITPDVAWTINAALDDRRRIIAVGTTTTRTLEAVARSHGGRLEPGEGETDLFIYPGFEFGVISGLVTNFHLPQSSLLMLVAAFAGREPVLAAYRAAIAERYRFYSYGDAMLIL